MKKIEKTPKTSDTLALNQYIIIMIVSLVAYIILGKTRKI